MTEGLSKQSDFWRGIGLLGLTFNHLLLWPYTSLSFALRFTYQSLGWVSFATVFFALAGVQWGRVAERNRNLWRWNLRRTAFLWAWVLVAVLIFRVGIESRLLRPAPWQNHIRWTENYGILYALAGVRLPWLLDVIWLHGWFGLFATILWSLPGVGVSALRIALVSCIFWISAQINFGQISPLFHEAPPWHVWTGWQILFVGCALSQRKEAARVVSYFRRKSTRRVLIVVIILMCVLKNFRILSDQDNLRQTRQFGPLFAINSAAWCFALAHIRRLRLPKWIAVIGRQSLAFYTVQCIFVYLLGSHWLLDENQTVYAFLTVMCVFIFFVAISQLCVQRESTICKIEE